jgi:hypothetical protein
MLTVDTLGYFLCLTKVMFAQYFWNFKTTLNAISTLKL